MAGRYSRRLRRSQAVTTFGPGAIVDLPEESVMLAGIDFWPKKKADEVVREPVLESLLGVEEFRAPPISGKWGGKIDRSIPVVLFPEWLICPICHRLAHYETLIGDISPRSTLKCNACGRPVYPARLIIACPKGHIDDFPWEWWVHEGKPCTGKPALKITSMGKTASLGDLIVRCETCKSSRSLSGATSAENFKDLQCTGKMPWLRAETECKNHPIPLQRGASNVYFSVLASSISIPPWSKSSALLQKLEGKLEGFRELPQVMWKTNIEAMQLPDKLGVTIDEIYNALVLGLKKEEDSDSIIVIGSEKELRYQEAQALSTEQGDESPFVEFRTREVEVHADLLPYISRVMLVERLREVRALRGFTRISPPDPSNAFKVEISPISKSYSPRWLPAVEVNGEGIYIELSEPRLAEWGLQPTIKERAQRVMTMYEDMCMRRDWKVERKISPRLLLTHSLAHLLIKQLSLESGYASASLRERLYVFEESEIEDGSRPIAGLLIYTSTVDSEGSLGGLVRQGFPERLRETISDGIAEASWCASDPLCIENEGIAAGMMNLAACHACLLVSETSCEEFNRLLDRGMMVGTMVDPDIGYFSDF